MTEQLSTLLRYLSAQNAMPAASPSVGYYLTQPNSLAPQSPQRPASQQLPQQQSSPQQRGQQAQGSPLFSHVASALLTLAEVARQAQSKLPIYPVVPPGTPTAAMRQALLGYEISKAQLEEEKRYHDLWAQIQREQLAEEKRYHDLWAQIQREQIATQSSGSASDLLEYILGQSASERSQRATASLLGYMNQTYDDFARRLADARKRAASAKNPKERAQALEKVRRLSQPLLHTLDAALRNPRIQKRVIYGGADLAVAIDSLVRRVARKSADAYFLDLIRSLKARGNLKAARAAADLATAYLSAKSMSALKGANQAIETLLWSEIKSVRR